MTLYEHRENLKRNTDAYSMDLERCSLTVVKHLKDVGYKRITLKRAPDIVKKFVNLIFIAQDKKPYLHIESELGLPFCWNSPSNKGWDIDYIKYEWGHLMSRNQNGEDAHNIENLCLQSARCNQHIQSSMNIEELKAYGGKLEEVIIKNAKARVRLFNSNDWKLLLKELEEWK